MTYINKFSKKLYFKLYLVKKIFLFFKGLFYCFTLKNIFSYFYEINFFAHEAEVNFCAYANKYKIF